MEYMTTHEAAEKWGYNPRTGYMYVGELCNAGRVPGARKMGRDWMIPSDVEREDIEAPDPTRHNLKYKRPAVRAAAQRATKRARQRQAAAKQATAQAEPEEVNDAAR